MLATNSIFRSIIAGLLLVLFALGITPKLALHDVLANHKDRTSIIDTHTGDQLSKTGFNCKCENQVAESPFTTPVETVLASLFSLHEKPQSPSLYAFYASPYFFFELRGPPATA